MLQFAHVSGPVITDQCLRSSLGNSRYEPAGLLFVVLQKMNYQNVNVLAALAEWRKMNRKDRKTIEQVAPESSFFDRAFQIDVRRSDHARVGLEHFAAADARELAVLKHAQNTHLRPQTHLADFIEKQCAAMRFFEPSPPSP